MAAAGFAGADGRTKLYISNLDHGVSNNDIKELLSEVGDLKRCTTHYDRNGRSSFLVPVFDRWNHGRGRGRGYGLGQSIDTGIVCVHNLRGRGRGPGGKQIVRKTAEDLDKELETYHAGAMDTS